jgi:hypothetical protein
MAMVVPYATMRVKMIATGRVTVGTTMTGDSYDTLLYGGDE